MNRIVFWRRTLVMLFRGFFRLRPFSQERRNKSNCLFTPRTRQHAKTKNGEERRKFPFRNDILFCFTLSSYRGVRHVWMRGLGFLGITFSSYRMRNKSGCGFFGPWEWGTWRSLQFHGWWYCFIRTTISLETVAEKDRFRSLAPINQEVFSDCAPPCGKTEKNRTVSF